MEAATVVGYIALIGPLVALAGLFLRERREADSAVASTSGELVGVSHALLADVQGELSVARADLASARALIAELESHPCHCVGRRGEHGEESPLPPPSPASRADT